MFFEEWPVRCPPGMSLLVLLHGRLTWGPLTHGSLELQTPTWRSLCLMVPVLSHTPSVFVFWIQQEQQNWTICKEREREIICRVSCGVLVGVHHWKWIPGCYCIAPAGFLLHQNPYGVMYPSICILTLNKPLNSLTWSFTLWPALVKGTCAPGCLGILP